MTTTAAELHADSVIFDGACVLRALDRASLEEIRSGGLTAANYNAVIWENFADVMRSLAAFKALIAENEDIAMQVYSTADIQEAKRSGRVGLVFGWQNTSPIEDRLYYLQLFRELGVGIAQLTYNTANWVGTGCYESGDGGLTDFGRDVVREMNRLRMVVDLSHCSDGTVADTVAVSGQPVALTHVCPAGLHPHARNKSDLVLRTVSEHDGMVGVALCPTFLRTGAASTLHDYVEAVEYVIEICGIDHVGLGMDLMADAIPSWIEYAIRDKGYGRFHIGDETVEDILEPLGPVGLRQFRELPALTGMLLERGWSEDHVRAFLGRNWTVFLHEVWGH